MSTKNFNNEDYINNSIEIMRKRILDTTERNPMISTKFSQKSNFLFRFVDGTENITSNTLVRESKNIKILPLPSLESDPLDEDNIEFNNVLKKEIMLNKDYEFRIQNDKDIFVRHIKDIVREKLGMKPRQTKNNLSLLIHAENNYINPNYDLELYKNIKNKNKYNKNTVQTLLLPEDLDSKASKLLSKCNSWEQESGINSLHFVFGFLEYCIKETKIHAPLLLVSVKLIKEKTPKGNNFSITSQGNEIEINFVLKELLQKQFNLDLPDFLGTSVEDYIENLISILPNYLNWKIHHQMALGIFPSTRIAMYHDLDTSKHNFSSNELISKLFFGNNNHDNIVFAEDYNCDNEDIEKKVPCLVMDADSSQYSAIVDAVNGNNLAIQGPPGTGKSQTIVNIIANSIASGKKVLFVAEKTAALEVVKSRLEYIGFGDFLLPLQASRSSRKEVIESIKSRFEFKDNNTINDYDLKIAQYKRIRSEISNYINFLNIRYDNIDMSIFDILSKNIKYNSLLSKFPIQIKELYFHNLDTYTKFNRHVLKEKCAILEKAIKAKNTYGKQWEHISLDKFDFFTADKIISLAKLISLSFEDLYNKINIAHNNFCFKINDVILLSNLNHALKYINDNKNNITLNLFLQLLNNKPSDVLYFKDKVDAKEAISKNCLSIVKDIKLISKCTVQKIISIVNKLNTKDVNLELFKNQIDYEFQQHRLLKQNIRSLANFIKLVPSARRFSLSTIIEANKIIKKYSREIYSLRNNANNTIDARNAIFKLCVIGKQLVEERGKISEFISFDFVFDESNIEHYITTLKTSGLFSIFSKDYRNAKKFYRSITKRHSFNKTTAVNDLLSLNNHLKKVKDFNSNDSAKQLFGYDFNNLQTNFDGFLSLINYYNDVDNTFKGIENAEIRIFLRDSDYEILNEIPFINSSKDYKNFVDYLRGYKYFTSTIKEHKQLYHQLSKALEVFVDEKYISIKILNTLNNYLRELDEISKYICNSPIASLLKSFFNSDNIDFSNIEHEINVIKFIKAHPQIYEYFVFILNNFNFDLLCKQFDSLLMCFVELENKVNNFNKLTGFSFSASIDLQQCKQRIDKFKSLSNDEIGLKSYIGYKQIYKEFVELGYSWLFSYFDDNQLLSNGVFSTLDSLYFYNFAKDIQKKYGEKILYYNGITLDELRKSFVDVDTEIIRLSRLKLLTIANNIGNNAPLGEHVGAKSTWTELALLRHEISKKTNFTPVRSLIRRASKALLHLKPCWMISPLAVAQYIPQESVQFDVCILDEASQMPPENAIGALSRCKQGIIVGDTNQLPPSNFFKKIFLDGDNEDNCVEECSMDESILHMAQMSFTPSRILKWHYRSKHHSLIEFSNNYVYNNTLIVFPSSSIENKDLGVYFVDSGGEYISGINIKEADTIIKYAIDFMCCNKNKSLGIVTMNQKQQDIIREKFDKIYFDNNSISEYIDYWSTHNDGLESFFIKNLENVQGDERDVIFIGTVYGPEKRGQKVAQRFGPINGISGKRRLNVLFTRAKEKIVTFSSMKPEDIIADEIKNPGVYMLKMWLEYSITKKIIDKNQFKNNIPESDFEIYVIQSLESMGYIAIPQVGVHGYRIDIGVRHDSWPFGYILGIECDGASYHSSKSARDRDRIRESVLKGLGWDIYRIWSTDWFYNPSGELEKLKKYLDNKLQVLKDNQYSVFNCYKINNAELNKYSNKIKIDSNIIADINKNNKNIQKSYLKAQDDNSYDNKTTNKSIDRFHQSTHITNNTSKIKSNFRQNSIIEVNDTVTITYIDTKKTITYTIINGYSNIKDGFISSDMPLSKCLLDAELGSVVDLVVDGKTIHKIHIDEIVKH